MSTKTYTSATPTAPVLKYFPFVEREQTGPQPPTDSLVSPSVGPIYHPDALRQEKTGASRDFTGRIEPATTALKYF